MKNQALPLLFVLLHFFGIPLMAQVKMGENPKELNASALLELESSNKGFLPTRLSTSQRDAISLPAKGLLIYNTSTNQMEVNFGTPEVPEWRTTIYSVTGLAISAEDTARWNLNAGWTVRVSEMGDTVYLPNGNTVLLPGVSQLNYPQESSAIVETRPVFRVGTTSVLAAGNIINAGGSPVQVRGFVWGTEASLKVGASNATTVVVGSGTGLFQSQVEGLSVAIPYYIRAFFINSQDTVYGSVVSFSIPEVSGTVTDVDGNIYETVTIGPQEWMASNLKTTRFNNGDTIALVSASAYWPEGEPWARNLAPKFCYYQNSLINQSLFGNLYNFFVVYDERNVCPVGWHVPTTSEWFYLFGNDSLMYDLLKVIDTGSVPLGTGYWIETPEGATNATGLNIQPAGFRGLDGVFDGKGRETVFWCENFDNYDLGQSTATGFPVVMYPGGKFSFPSSTVSWRARDRRSGYSIRCVKDY